MRFIELWFGNKKSENAVEKNETNRFAQCRVAKIRKKLQNTVSAKHNEMKHNKIRYACTEFWRELNT